MFGFGIKLWLLLINQGYDFFIWVEHKVSLIPIYVWHHFCIFFQVYFLLFSYLYGNDVLCLAGKSSVHWSISLVKSLLGGKEISIMAEASTFTGASPHEY